MRNWTASIILKTLNLYYLEFTIRCRLTSRFNLLNEFIELRGGEVKWWQYFEQNSSEERGMIGIYISQFLFIWLFRTCSQLLSRLITVRSSPQPVIAPSSSGTLWVFVNTPSKNKDTPNGSHVYASPLLPRNVIWSENKSYCLICT